MKIENTEVYGFRAALRAIRNPRESWDKNDSGFWDKDQLWIQEGSYNIRVPERPNLGPNDLDLSYRLVKAGSEHRKFLRQIIIWADLTLPRYVLQELDTYKVATVRNSCSTIHKLGQRDLTLEDFQNGNVLPEVLNALNAAGVQYRMKQEFYSPETPETELWSFDIVRWMKKHLPEGFLQKITYTMSYETALSMLLQRGKHRLPEWSGPEGICAWLRTLPYLAMWEKAVLG